MHIITQLDDDYSPIVADIKVRDNSISHFELFHKLTDFERLLKDKGTSITRLIATINATQCHNKKVFKLSATFTKFKSALPRANDTKILWGLPFQNTQYNSPWSQLFCNYCDIPSHDTRECRKLARFLKINNGFVHTQQPVQPPVANVTTSQNS